ncbi:ATP-binding protein [Methylobacterium oxalidis]|uniref:histidine kinase n=1 Tax=Methylobacterium oxalidis TaxID=944322 RepID=A0A512JBJ7_9HYPH|nr:ATP-binding protein [Methylobacterium oxalidis]GEP07271.1 two-component sensor histidine kinase [Methylobacterium oxalidis]GJE34670.1 Adaptive-response sensory-kinase SasA [Methylobacterium oxalidis]GLS63779.1 two-component sensor histidine kinase [Methylobacterium oxalidis]
MTARVLLPRMMARLRPRSVAGQIALLVVAAIAVAHVVATVAFVLLREPWRPDDHPGVAANRLATVARLLDGAEPEERAALLRNAARSLPTLRLAPWDGNAPGAGAEDLDGHPIVGRLRDGFGRPLAVVDLAPGEGRREALRLGIVTPGGAVLSASLPDEPLRSPRQGAVIFTVVFLGLTLTLLCVWAARALTAPLARLAVAAEAFGARNDIVALPQRGPEEVLAVSRALERMRERVRRLLDDRTQMLAAISHDLRTPITRLRLRAEFIEDEHARTMTLRDLDQMNGLVEAALSYVRDGQGTEAGQMVLVDLASVVQTVCDGFSDIGADVQVERARHLLVRGRPDELQRALTNLVENAVKYGGSAVLRMDGGPRGAAVEVCDRGPGIPEAEREAMLQPFVRGDRARNLNEASGFGLGLSIVLAIAESHQGRLVLANRPRGGLRARFELPSAAQAMPPGDTRPAAPAPLAAE